MVEFYLLLKGREALDSYVVFLAEANRNGEKNRTFTLPREQFVRVRARYFTEAGKDFGGYGGGLMFPLTADPGQTLPEGEFHIATVGGVVTVRQQ